MKSYTFWHTTNKYNKQIRPVKRYVLVFNTFTNNDRLSCSQSEYDDINDCLDEDYTADFESKGLEYPEEYYDRTPFKVDNGMSRMECYDLLSRVVDNVSEPFLIEHGFTKNQIKDIKGE